MNTVGDSYYILDQPASVPCKCDRFTLQHLGHPNWRLQQLPRSVQTGKLCTVSCTMKLLSRGGIGTVCQVNDVVAVKIAREGEEPDHAKEQVILSTLELCTPCPYLVQSFFRVPQITFLELLPNGDLASLLRQSQTLDPRTQRVLAVKGTPQLELTCQWMRELCCGAEWLEKIGLAHCDIRPANILLGFKSHAKLADFDCSIKVGENLDCGTEPFARLLGEEAGQECGTYGKAGPRTETFAIGSVFYSLMRGHDPYENEWFGKHHGRTLVAKFQNMQFPPTTKSVIDTIIRSCWSGNFVSVKCLLDKIMQLDTGNQEVVLENDAGWINARKEECKVIVESGALETLDRF